MNDTIYRQAVIDTLLTAYPLLQKSHLVRTINDIPPAEQPERKTGSPIVDEDGNMSCPFCGSSECWGNYCMECGARMVGE